ncbi:15005_t:CDS:2 [Funneliformis geosporum]|nr:15005_t:CDS:2 [Funneliformis geosporum]
MTRNKVLRWFGKHEEDQYEYCQEGTDGPLKIQWQKPHETNEKDAWRNTLGKNFESVLKNRDSKKYRSLPTSSKKPEERLKIKDARRFGMVDPFKYASYIDDKGWNPIAYFAQELQKEEEMKKRKGDNSNTTNEAEDLVNMIITGNLSRSGRESQRRDSGVSNVNSKPERNRKSSVSSTSTIKPPVPNKSSKRIQEKRNSKICPTCKGTVAVGGYYTQWCPPCENRNFEDLFEKWSSGNDVVDCFILESQLNAKSRFDYLEWIPFDRFKDVQLIGLGGFGSVYNAIWLDGPREKMDTKTGQYVRCGEWRIALKCFDNSENITSDFFEEAHLRCENNSGNYIIRCYGITQCPKTKNYMIVMQYARNGDLRKYMSKNSVGLTWQRKLDILYGIATGLNRIHCKNLVHRNLHCGNILIHSSMTLISDLGLCRRADNPHATGGAFGVLPYVAPEILRAKPYTKAADVYSFGTVMWELAFGRKPFSDRAHDLELATDIVNGAHPEIIEEIPECYLDLMKRCWDLDPFARPSAERLYVTVGEWLCKVFNVRESNISVQFLEAERRRLASIREGTGTINTPDQIESPINTPIHSPTSSEFNFDKHEHFEATFKSSFLKFESLQEPTIIFTRTNDPREHLAVQKYMAEETRLLVIVPLLTIIHFLMDNKER